MDTDRYRPVKAWHVGGGRRPHRSSPQWRATTMGRWRDLDAHTHRLEHHKAAMETGRYEPVKAAAIDPYRS